jgi:glyoxylase-like metal-dependent hydrolase (beta-lactamase superfamily II)
MQYFISTARKIVMDDKKAQRKHIQKSSLKALNLLMLSLTLMVSSCATDTYQFINADSFHVQRFAGKWSNIFLVSQGDSTVIVDAGSPDDLRDFRAYLSEKMKNTSVSCLLLTHGHADHAGLSSALHDEFDLTVFIGKQDQTMISEGKNTPLKPQNFMGVIMKSFVDFEFPPFMDSIAIEKTSNLESTCGVSINAVPMPGHTPGSMVYSIGEHIFVGDLVLGGHLGGTFSPTKPTEHYFHGNAQKNFENIKKLLKDNQYKWFHLGHGGPVLKEVLKQRIEKLSPGRE